MKDGTRIEVLQLPLDGDQRLVSQRSESQGRLLAIDSQSIDPAHAA
ncbi:MAG: Slp family lipoprotein [Nitrospira sp.]